MVAHIIKDAEIRFGGRDISGILNQVSLDYNAELQDGTVFGLSSRRRVSGMTVASINVNGFYDDTIADKEFFDGIGNEVDTVLTVAPNGDVFGDKAFFMETQQAQYTPGGNIGELLAFVAEFQSASDFVRGNVFQSGVLSSSGNSAGSQLGALADASEKVYAAVHITAESGAAPTFDLTIESSSDGSFDSTTITRITFAQFTAIGAQFSSVVGPITDPFWRAVWTIGGGGPSFTAFIVIGKYAIS